MKSGTKIEIGVMQASGSQGWEKAVVAPWRKYMGRREDRLGYHPVRFASGGILMVHESGFRALPDRR